MTHPAPYAGDTGSPLADGVQLRTLRPADLAPVENLYRIYTASSIDATRFARDVGQLPSAGAFLDDRLIGFAYCYRFAPDMLELANIHVAREARNHGLGGQLLQHILAACAPEHAAMIAVNSLARAAHESRRQPLNLYERHGFRVVHRTSQTTVFLRDLTG